MIANYVNKQHDSWDQFLREFAYAIRTAVNETTGKTPTELFLGRKLITPFQTELVILVLFEKLDEVELICRTVQLHEILRKESRPTIERKAQRGPARSRKGRERNDSPYIEERTRSSNKNARRGGDQQRQDQERRGTWTKKSLSLVVLVGNSNYKS
ncbi:hypothetical protein TNCV_1727261 [Trichonephila clavipes]|nr:hypothetical protein TNCV_1727261 [Trichonephila clavipes]